MKTVLTIAGSDCSGGAGIQADLKTMAAMGCYGMSVITAVTVQNTCGVKAVYPMDAHVVREQFDAIVSDIYPDAIKIGMLCNEEIIEVVSAGLEKIRQKGEKGPWIVLDPVLVSTSGKALLKPEAKKVLEERLLPLMDLVTPNLSEMQELSQRQIKKKSQREEAALWLATKYHCGVLVKGGHGKEYGASQAEDLLVDGKEKKTIWISAPFIDNPNTHGTGCTLSSAIACELAKGCSMAESVKNGKEYLTGAIAAGLNLGKGNGPLNHIYNV